MFDLDLACNLLDTLRPSNCVLQFEERFLQYSIATFNFLKQAYGSNVQFFINADSTWGTSADDVSAAHVNGEMVLFFGSDLSINSPKVFLIPALYSVDYRQCCEVLRTSLSSNIPSVLLYEAGYLWLAIKLSFIMDNFLVARPGNEIGAAFNHNEKEYDADGERVGGLMLSRAIIDYPGSYNIIYLGQNEEQLNRIRLRLPSHSIYHMIPRDFSCKRLETNSAILNERYGGVAKVKDSAIIGLILGSMGISADLSKKLMKRLETLIRAAGKHFYTLVMGRVEEAKLENFPEVPLRSILP